MQRALSLICAAAMAATAAPMGGADETFPVVHSEPIFIHVLDGKDGRPLPRVHLIVFAGYDEADIQRRLWQEEALTDDRGQAQLSNQVTNLPFVQVWPLKMKTCEESPRAERFSMERIRIDGLSAPNRCGPVAVADAPGIFNFFVKTKTKKDKKLKKTTQSSSAMLVRPVRKEL